MSGTEAPDTSASGRPPTDRRWWIGEGAERCPICFQGYALEVEVRCVDCDEPGCMHCFVTVVASGVVVDLCPSCAEERGAARSGGTARMDG